MRGKVKVYSPLWRGEERSPGSGSESCVSRSQANLISPVKRLSRVLS